MWHVSSHSGVATLQTAILVTVQQLTDRLIDHVAPCSDNVDDRLTDPCLKTTIG